MKNRLLKFSCMLVLTAIMFSCDKENMEEIATEQTATKGQKMLFDETGYNPYLPEKMQLAFDSLKAKIYHTFPAARITTEGIELDFTPNKKYVRFLPADSVELDTLLGYENLALYNHPLDLPIVQEGEYTPGAANDAGFEWLYGVVPIDFNFPNVGYEVISDIFIPKYPNTEYEGHEGGRILGDSLEIYGMLMGTELYSMYLSGHMDQEEADEYLAMLEGRKPTGGRKESSGWDIFIEALKSVKTALGSILVTPAYAKKANPLNWCWGCIFNSSWRPSGSVRVSDGSLNQPIRGVKVVIHRGLKSIVAYTNDDGHFSSWSKFGSKVTYTVHWRNRSPRTFGTRYFRLVDKWYMATAKHHIKTNTRSRIDYTYSLVNGRPEGEDAALAMIYLAAQHNYHRNIIGLKRPKKNLRIRIRSGERGSTGQHRSFNYHMLGSQIHMWLRQENGQFKTGQRLVASTFHELAHHTHYREVRDWLWPASQYEWLRVDCGLKESWATCVEHYLTRATYYPNFTEGYNERRWDQFNSEYTAIFIDIIDDDNQRARLGGNRPNDRVSGYTIAQVESAVYGNNNNLFSEIFHELSTSNNITSGFIDDLYEEYRNNVTYDCSPFYEREWE